jgi:hypothetical protein
VAWGCTSRREGPAKATDHHPSASDAPLRGGGSVGGLQGLVGTRWDFLSRSRSGIRQSAVGEMKRGEIGVSANLPPPNKRHPLRSKKMCLCKMPMAWTWTMDYGSNAGLRVPCACTSAARVALHITTTLALHVTTTSAVGAA